MVNRLCLPIIILAAAVIYTPIAHSATTVPWQPDASWFAQRYLNIHKQQMIASGQIRPPITFETKATTPAGQQVTRYATRPVTLTASRASQAFGGALMRSTPVGLAVSTALIALPYIFDEDSQEFTAEPITLPSTPIGRCGLGSPNSSTLSECYIRSLSSGGSVNTIETRVRPVPLTPDLQCAVIDRRYSYSPNTWTPYVGWWCPVGFDLNSEQSEAIIPKPSEPVEPQHIIQVLPAELIPQLIDEVLKSPTWREDWPELAETSDAINRDMENALEGATHTGTDPNTEPNSTVNARPNTTTSPSTESEWPVFCTWAKPVCDFIDWFKTDEEVEDPELPLVDYEVEEQEYNSGLPTNGTCPANTAIPISFLGTTVELSYEPICDFAVTARPFVLLAAYLLSAFILVAPIRGK